jgi:hypothetical protein
MLRLVLKQYRHHVYIASAHELKHVLPYLKLYRTTGIAAKRNDDHSSIGGPRRQSTGDYAVRKE